MMYWDDQASGWGWVAMTVSMVLFWGLLVTAFILLMRSSWTRGREERRVRRDTPEQLLAVRFARGEITEDEFTHGIATLRSQLHS